jgi:hypothetical protein
MVNDVLGGDVTQWARTDHPDDPELVRTNPHGFGDRIVCNQPSRPRFFVLQDADGGNDAVAAYG